MKDDLNSIPQTVTNETRDVVQSERLPLLSPFASSLIGLFYQIKAIYLSSSRQQEAVGGLENGDLPV